MNKFYELVGNFSRNFIRSLPAGEQRNAARREVKMLLIAPGLAGPVGDSDVPDVLIDDTMIDRYLAISPPWAALIPEFQPIVDEIEASYVAGRYFSALSASCVAIERLLNSARISLHKHHSPIKALWNKGPVDDWRQNIEALEQWGYLKREHATELRDLYAEVRGRYFHSGGLSQLEQDSLRTVQAAYKLISLLLGFPSDLFEIREGRFVCINPNDPRFREFYEPSFKESP